jgi:hypothetical protein
LFSEDSEKGKPEAIGRIQMGKKLVGLSRASIVLVGILAVVTVLELTISYQTVQTCAFRLGVRTAEWVSR